MALTTALAVFTGCLSGDAGPAATSAPERPLLTFEEGAPGAPQAEDSPQEAPSQTPSSEQQDGSAGKDGEAGADGQDGEAGEGGSSGRCVNVGSPDSCNKGENGSS